MAVAPKAPKPARPLRASARAFAGFGVRESHIAIDADTAGNTTVVDRNAAHLRRGIGREQASEHQTRRGKHGVQPFSHATGPPFCEPPADVTGARR